jgi:hypothetical protein
MRRTGELECRLREWADEFAGSKYENIGYASKSWLHNAIVYHGPAPQGLNPRSSGARTPADEVEAAVVALEKQEGGYRAARVLRAEYWMKSAAEEHKIQSLRHIGLPMGRTKYYDELWLARVHVAAWLRISASVELPMAS